MPGTLTHSQVFFILHHMGCVFIVAFSEVNT